MIIYYGEVVFKIRRAISLFVFIFTLGCCPVLAEEPQPAHYLIWGSSISAVSLSTDTIKMWGQKDTGRLERETYVIQSQRNPNLFIVKITTISTKLGILIMNKQAQRITTMPKGFNDVAPIDKDKENE